MDSGFKVADLDQDSITKVIDKVEKDIYHILPQSKVAQKEILKEEQKATVPITITIEKATNLPLMQDPLASSLQSPFVKVSDTKTALANASCSFTLPEQLGGGVWQSAIVQAQSNPNFNFSTTSRLICTQESLDEIKKMFLEFQVYHHLPLSFTSSNSFVSDLEMELVGTVKIDLGALFSMDEIYGWYDLMNGDEGVGQVLIRISPEQSLASIYKELERDASFTGHIDESVVMEEVFEWDGSEWVSKMVARPKIKAKSIDVKQKGNLSLENALGDIQNLHSSMMERFKGLGLNSNSNYKDAKTESDCQSSVAFEGSFYEEECDDSSLSPIGDTGDKRNNHSNPFLDHDQSNSLSEFMNSVVRLF